MTSLDLLRDIQKELEGMLTEKYKHLSGATDWAEFNLRKGEIANTINTLNKINGRITEGRY